MWSSYKLGILLRKILEIGALLLRFCNKPPTGLGWEATIWIGALSGARLNKGELKVLAASRVLPWLMPTPLHLEVSEVRSFAKALYANIHGRQGSFPRRWESGIKAIPLTPTLNPLGYNLPLRCKVGKATRRSSLRNLGPTSLNLVVELGELHGLILGQSELSDGRKGASSTITSCVLYRIESWDDSACGKKSYKAWIEEGEDSTRHKAISLTHSGIAIEFNFDCLCASLILQAKDACMQYSLLLQMVGKFKKIVPISKWSYMQTLVEVDMKFPQRTWKAPIVFHHTTIGFKICL